MPPVTPLSRDPRAATPPDDGALENIGRQLREIAHMAHHPRTPLWVNAATFAYCRDEFERFRTGEAAQKFRSLLEQLHECGGIALSSSPFVASFGCSISSEAAAVQSFFSARTLGDLSGPTRVYGFDWDESALQWARLIYESGERSLVPERSEADSRFRFIGMDLSREAPSFPEPPGLVLLRHQHVVSGPAVWKKIYECALATVAAEGTVLVTSYTERERSVSHDLMLDLGARLRSTLRNPQNGEAGGPAYGLETDGWMDAYAAL